MLADSFAHEARRQGVRNAVITAVASVLMVGNVAEVAEGKAAATEARLLAGETGLAEGLSLEEAAALEARLAEAETLESGTRHPAQPEKQSMSEREIEKQLTADAQEALTKYGGKVEVRRPGHPRGYGTKPGHRTALPCTAMIGTRMTISPCASSLLATREARVSLARP